MTKILFKIKKGAATWLLPWVATIVTALPYNNQLSRCLDRLVCWQEGAC